MPTNCLSVFDHVVGFALKGLRLRQTSMMKIWGENDLQFSVINYYRKKPLSKMFDRTLAVLKNLENIFPCSIFSKLCVKFFISSMMKLFCGNS